MPMILRTSAASPFGRKVLMAARATGLSSRLEIRLANTSDADDSLRAENPLGKIPALILDDGEVLFDSRVIVDYLDALDGRQMLIPPGPHRLHSLRLQALADGILDAAILQVYESRFRSPQQHSQEWLSHQQGKVDRALAFASGNLPAQFFVGPHIGEIALAAALGYLDLRFDGRWRHAHPSLAGWLSAFDARTPAFATTAPR